MTRLNLTTQQLEYLLAVDRAPTWATAADELGVTASALSQGIAELERRLGVSLFERDGRRRVPSRNHAEVLRYAERTVAATHDLERWLAQRRSGSSGTIRIGLIDTAATHHFRDVLRGFRTARADLELRLTVAPSSELLVLLSRAEIDLAVCVRPAITPPDLEVEPLLQDPLAVLAPAGVGTEPSHGSRWGPWVTFPASSHTRGLIAAALAAEGRSFDVVAESHQPEVLLEMVRLGIGWTVLPLAGLGPLDDVSLVRRRLAERQLVVARRSGASPDAAVDALQEALLALK